MTTDKPSVLEVCVRDKVPVVVYWTGPDDELEGVFEDFLPTMRAASFSFVTWMCKTELTDREVWVALDGRAFEGKRLVEVENAAK